MEDVEPQYIIAFAVPYYICVFTRAGYLLTVAWQHLINRDKMQKGIGNILGQHKKNRSNIRS
jgi:CIC family chloride channel protein